MRLPALRYVLVAAIDGYALPENEISDIKYLSVRSDPDGRLPLK